MSFQISAEQDVLKKMGEFRERIPKAKPGQKTKFQDELVMLNELLQVRQVLIKSRTFRVFMNQKLPQFSCTSFWSLFPCRIVCDVVFFAVL